MPIHGKSANPSQICLSYANSIPICQFITYLPIHLQSTNLMPICQSNANLVILDQSNANPYQICQSITNSSIQPQFYTNLPIHNQFTNSSSIWPLHAPISANRKNRTVTDRQDIGTHWHRSRQSRASAADNRGPFHTDTDHRHSIRNQSGTNRKPIGTDFVE